MRLGLRPKVQTVHTSGINLESVLVITASVVTLVGAFTAWIGRQIRHSIDDLSTTLQGRLETKEVVNGINTRLTVLESSVREAIHGK